MEAWLMAGGNQGRRGAQRRKTVAPSKGSGAKNRRTLEGRGATPKAQERTYHPAYQEAKRVEKRKADQVAAAKGRMKTRVKVQPGSELLVGRNTVIEAAKSGVQVSRIFLSADPGDGRMREVVEALAPLGVPFLEVTKRDLDIASDFSAHQGVGIEVEEYKYADLDDVLVSALSGNNLTVALDHITDPHNIGAVLRSSAAFGVDGLILPERRSAGIGATAWKVSAGAAAKVPAARVGNLVQALERAKAAGFFVVGLEGTAEAKVRDFPLVNDPLVLVTGAEGSGLSRLVKQTCDLLIGIDAPGMESLNAAVATGIALYEISARRGE